MTMILQKGGTVSDGSGLFDVVRELAKNAAAQKAAALSDLTDNSAGTSGSGTIAAIPSLTAFTATGTDLAPKAGFDTALGTARNALRTIQEKLATTATAIGVDLGYTYSGGGTDGTGTVAAVTKALTAVDGTGSNGLAFAGTNTVLATYENAIATIAKGVNRVREAVGLGLIVDNSGGTYQTTVAALAVTTGAGVAGTALSGVAETDAEAALAAIANAVATLAAALNQVTANTAALTVSAV